MRTICRVAVAGLLFGVCLAWFIVYLPFRPWLSNPGPVEFDPELDSDDGGEDLDDYREIA